MIPHHSFLRAFYGLAVGSFYQRLSDAGRAVTGDLPRSIGEEMWLRQQVWQRGRDVNPLTETGGEPC